MEDLGRIRHRIDKFLTRHGYLYTDGKAWTQKHLNWLGALRPEQSMLRQVLGNYLEELTCCMHRLKTLDGQVAELAQSQPYAPLVGALRCFRGIDTLTAICLVTEIFEFGRFASPRQLMSYLGLTPSEHSSGESQKRGSLCKTGNKRVRRLLCETAWHYRHPYKVGKALKSRRAGQPDWAIALADKAGYRLSRRYWRLTSKGKLPVKATMAVARELAGFLWAMLRTPNLSPTG